MTVSLLTPKAISTQELRQFLDYGAARARATNRAWYLMQCTATGRLTLTPEPGPVTRWAPLRVFKPKTGAQPVNL